jgi:hypothetical protein
MGAAVISVLSDERGEYAIRAPGAGRYVVSAKRIGARRAASPPFDLASGETRRVDLALDAVLYTLPEVVVSTTAVCLTRPAQAQRVASLWEEARTALTATQISLRDRLFNGRVTRYVRELDPVSLKVLSESRSDMAGVLSSPSATVSADSLSSVGYWWDLPDGTSQVYNAPDTDVLMSAAFLRDHCFDAVDGGRNRRGLVGVAFDPVPARKVPDIRGTLWLDARTFELRYLEFRYTRMRSADSVNVGGELYFARLPSGAWLVRRWFIRMPQFARYETSPVSTDIHRPMVLIRPTAYRLIEDGGDVFSEGLRLFDKPAVVTGVVLDSAGAPLAGAAVRLSGTPFATKTDAQGHFRLDSLPAGSHTVAAEHPSYAALGMLVDDEPLRLEEGVTERVTLRGAGTATIHARLCDGKPAVRNRATLRLTMFNADASPMGFANVWVRWELPREQQTEPGSVLFGGVQSRTDTRGVATFCELPAGTPLEIHLLRRDDPGSGAARSVRVAGLLLPQNQVTARAITTKRPE